MGRVTSIVFYASWYNTNVTIEWALGGDLIDSADRDGTFVNRIVAGNEKWCFQYDTQRQSAIWKSPSSPRKNPGQDRSKGIVMLEMFFRCCSHRIHPRKNDCKQAPLQGDLSPSTHFDSPEL
jgi:hypothetical protein